MTKKIKQKQDDIKLEFKEGHWKKADPATPTYAPQVPKDFVHMDAFCVCGEKLVLELQPPDFKSISWHKFCMKCRHHVYFSVSR
jgi:hypothetical protein